VDAGLAYRTEGVMRRREAGRKERERERRERGEREREQEMESCGG